jgi:hypothetical protein
MAANGRGGDDDKVARSGQGVSNISGGRAQQALLDEHVVGFGPGLNLDANQVSILAANERLEGESVGK